VLLQARRALDKRPELLHPTEDRLDTHSGALPVLTKCGNSILTEACLRIRCSLLEDGSSSAAEAPDSAEVLEVSAGSPHYDSARTLTFLPAFTNRLALNLQGEVMVKVGGRTSCRAGAEPVGSSRHPHYLRKNPLNWEIPWSELGIEN
jgi:hypothetical protein